MPVTGSASGKVDLAAGAEGEVSGTVYDGCTGCDASAARANPTGYRTKTGGVKIVAPAKQNPPDCSRSITCNCSPTGFSLALCFMAVLRL